MQIRQYGLINLWLHILFLIIPGIYTNVQIQAQTYFFDNYSTAQGFESKVYTIVQDKQHYVWLGTQSGVTKFDGRSFTGFTTEEGIAQGGVRVLCIDHNQVLWLGHEGGGITRFNGKSFEIISILDTVIRSNITSIKTDHDNHLWITTELDGALVITNPDTAAGSLKFEHYLKGKSLGDQVFNSMVSSDGTIYFITNVGIRTYNKETNTFESYTPDGMFNYFITTVMYEDSKGNLWFGTYNGGLSKLNKIDNKFTFYDTRNGLAANWVSVITEDSKGNIWVGHWSDDLTSGGISRINPAGEIKVYNTSNGLHDNRIWNITEDAEGNILVGTTEQGLDIFKGERFISYSINDGLLNNQVYAFIEDPEGQIWFGTNEGISVNSGKGSRSGFQHYNQSNALISNQIRFLKKDRNDNIWIGTADQGVMLYNTRLKKFIAQPLINSYLPYQTISKGIRALEIGDEGNLWIGTIDGLVEYDIKADKYVATYTQGTGLAGNDITTLFTSPEGDLWIGSRSKGLTRMHQGKFTIIKGTGNITPTCITIDQDKKIWIGTESKGLLILERDTLKQISASDGLLANLVNVIICDKENNIYVGTNHGLNKIDQQTNKILTYTRRLGFVGIETKNNACCIDRNGNLWFGTANGAIRCNTALMQEEIPEPAVQITEMSVKGVPVERTKGLKLASNRNDITFKYISISMTNPEGILYQVMLEGLHDNWQDLKNENMIAFNKLQPGKYRFRVRARNDNGVWTSEPAEYRFRILAPFYQRGYFIFGIIILSILSLIGYIRIRERNLIEEKRILEEKVKERTLALSNANEELFMKNKDITDSITYAKRIQLAILPLEIPFNDTFILFKPKDIVSGDFYWMNYAGGKEFIIAADCTGHGVPGAFMSFIGYTSLNKIIIEQEIYKPSLILNRLNEEVAKLMHQKGEDVVNDGMDIALVCYTHATNTLEYAGALNPLVLVRNKEIIEIKADRFAIGRSSVKEKKFTNHELQLEDGDTIYLFSDGYADQFGGSEGKKFKTSALKDLFIRINNHSISKQGEILEKTFEDWKVGQQQIDDVLIVGRRFRTLTGIPSKAPLG
jgi:ligand-binding sensor domain-containing protein/serine phosphatase RsbU (regulator of sigma subunit)